MIVRHMRPIASLSIDKLGPLRFGAAAAMALAVAFGCGPNIDSAQAQITVEMLIGDAVSDTTSPRYANVNEAIKRFANRDALSARALLEAAQKEDPTLPPTDLTLAKMYFVSRNAVAGRAALEKAVADFPNDPEAFIFLGEQAVAQGNTIEAEALFDKALQLTDKFTENPKRKRNFGIRTRWGRASIAERRKNWPAMANELQALLGIDDKHASAHYRMGIAQCMLNDFGKGLSEFTKARQEDKNLPNPWMAIATMFDRIGRSDDARKAFRRALDEEKTDLNTMASYAQWLIRSGSLEEAESQLSVARKTHPDSVDILVLSGVDARMRGKPDEAEEHFVTALGKSPAHGGVINQLAQLLIEQENDEKKNRALQFAGINAKLNPDSADAQITLAWIYFKLGKLNEFVNTLRSGLQMGSFQPDSSYLVAQMLVSLKQPEQTEAAKRLLTETLASEASGIFVYRKEAQTLLDSLNRDGGR